MTTKFICKSCGAESPVGIGYAVSASHETPAPSATCPGAHAEVAA